MRLIILSLIAMTALSAQTAARAETCKIQSTRGPDEWKFVKVYEGGTDKVVLQQAIRGGVLKEVTVSGDRVRIDTKMPGQIDYEIGKIVLCKGGNTISV